MIKVDFVIPWVNGNDPKWQEEKNLYNPNANSDHGEVRYRDMENLKYVFRGIEENASWVNKIHFITWGHLPKFLNIDHPKLNIVYHQDFIPNEYLPTFSSHPIELNMHRIKGLSEHFVYFNDDMFLLKKTEVSDFFEDGLPCDQALLDYITSDKGTIFPHILLNNIDLVNQNFNKKDMISKNKKKWYSNKYSIKTRLKNLYLSPLNNFSGIKWHHLPVPYLKSTLEDSWSLYYDSLDKTSKNKFRSITDVNQYVFRNHQLVNGNFSPYNVDALGKFYNLPHLLDNLEQDLNNDSYKIYCINDSNEIEDFDKVKTKVIDLLDRKLPNKSSFEN